MARRSVPDIVGIDADSRSADEGGMTMHHPETLRHMARERQQRYLDEARHDRLVRELSSVSRQEPRERFRIRDLRWILFGPSSRPATA